MPMYCNSSGIRIYEWFCWDHISGEMYQYLFLFYFCLLIMNYFLKITDCYSEFIFGIVITYFILLRWMFEFLPHTFYFCYVNHLSFILQKMKLFKYIMSDGDIFHTFRTPSKINQILFENLYGNYLQSPFLFTR